MNILGTQYTLVNKAYEIYLAGCAGNPHCEGCHNPESWDFNAGEPWQDKFDREMSKSLATFSILIKNVMIFGGEPFDQDPDELHALMLCLASYDKPIWIFTRYELSDIPRKHIPSKHLSTYLKCGRYIPSLACDTNVQYGIRLATSNQRIYKRGVDY